MKLNFNAAEVDPSSSFDPVPAGVYTAEITESEEKMNKAGTGTYLQLTFRITEGDHTGRMIWDRLNLKNDNQDAVAIARANLSAICRAVNELNLEDSSQLHGKPMKIKVKVRPATEQWDASNEISAYMPLGNQPVSAPSTAKQEQAAAASRPW